MNLSTNCILANFAVSVKELGGIHNRFTIHATSQLLCDRFMNTCHKKKIKYLKWVCSFTGMGLITRMDIDIWHFVL